MRFDTKPSAACGVFVTGLPQELGDPQEENDEPHRYFTQLCRKFGLLQQMMIFRGHKPDRATAPQRQLARGGKLSAIVNYYTQRAAKRARVGLHGRSFQMEALDGRPLGPRCSTTRRAAFP